MAAPQWDWAPKQQVPIDQIIAAAQKGGWGPVIDKLINGFQQGVQSGRENKQYRDDQQLQKETQGTIAGMVNDPNIPESARNWLTLSGRYINRENAPQLLPPLGKMLSPKGPAGMTPAQEASLTERKRQFDLRRQDNAKIMQFRKSMVAAEQALRAAGQKMQADKMKAQIDQWDAQHWLLYTLGMGPDPSSIESGGQQDFDYQETP